MLEAIEKLLILQDRDRKISRLRGELANIGPERQALEAKTASSQAALDVARQRSKQLESDRKKLELEVESKKQAIERYSLQQFQTKRMTSTARWPTKLKWPGGTSSNSKTNNWN